MPKKGAILDKVRALRDKKATANAAIEQAESTEVAISTVPESTEVAISTEEEALRLGKKDGEKATDAEGSGVAGEADQSVEELCEGEGGSASEGGLRVSLVLSLAWPRSAGCAVSRVTGTPPCCSGFVHGCCFCSRSDFVRCRP